MVKSLKQRFSNIDATFLIALVIAIALTILATWFMASYVLNEIIQGLLYPYSDYPVIVSSSVDILIFPASLNHGVNHFESDGERISVSGNLEIK